MSMDTRDLIERRLAHALDLINGQRMVAGKTAGVRMDVDVAPRGIMPAEDWYYRFRVELRFAPLMTLRVGYKQSVFYFDVEGAKVSSDVYKVTKHPPRRTGDTFWRANELDAPLDAIERHMKEVLS